jgi:ribosomal protein L21E
MSSDEKYAIIAPDVVNAIKSGAMDSFLADFENAINERRASRRTTTTISDFAVGDRVRVNTYASPQYIHGETGTVVNMHRTKLTMRFDRPVGRFSRVDEKGISHAVEVKVPATIIDKV